MRINYGQAICEAFRYLLRKYPRVFTIGQGLWSPWYVGNSMQALEQEFGKARVIDTPVSEQACTGAAIGAAVCGFRPIVIHPRVDFALLAVDQMVNQAAKWRHMLGGKPHCPVTFRLIINRGGQQGAQHSQSLHAWFSHIPGLRVVMPYSVRDARDLLISSVLCNDPVVYLDDRWLYELEEELSPIEEFSLEEQGPKVIQEGEDVTLVGSGFSTHLCKKAAEKLTDQEIHCEVIDLRILNPIRWETVLASLQKTGRLVVVDGDWRSCGLAGEMIAAMSERLDLTLWKANPVRLTLPDAPAPSSSALESIYYTTETQIIQAVQALFQKDKKEAKLRIHETAR